MMQFEFVFSDFLDAVKFRIGYIAGKRADNPEIYFRLSACDSDLGVLHELALESVAAVSQRLGKLSGGYSLLADTLTIRLNVSQEENEYRRDEISTLLREALTTCLLSRWLGIANAADVAEWEGKHENSIAALISFSAFSPKPRPREVPPI